MPPHRLGCSVDGPWDSLPLMRSRISFSSSVGADLMRASAFFSIQKKNGAVNYARGDDFISPLVIRSQPPLAEEPEKSSLGPR